MGMNPILANLIGYAFAFGVMFLVWRKPLTAWWSRTRAEAQRHAEEHGKVVQFPGADATGVSLHMTGDPTLDALENDVSPVATASAGQGNDPARLKTDKWASAVNDTLIVLFIAGAIRAWVLWPFVGPLALVNWFSVPFVALLVALVVVYVRHGAGEHFSYVSGRLLAHEIRGLWLRATHAHPSHLRAHEQKRVDLVLEAHQARGRDQEIHKAREFQKMMEMRMLAGRAALENAMERAVGLHETTTRKVTQRVPVRASDGSTTYKTEQKEVVERHRLARVEGKVVDLRAVYHLRWLATSFDAKIAGAWEKICADATLVLRTSIGDLGPDRVNYVPHTGELAVDLVATIVFDPTPELIPEVEDEPPAPPLDLETPLAVGRPPVALLSTPNRHADGRPNEGKGAAKLILSAFAQAGVSGCEVVDILPGPVLSTVIIKTPTDVPAPKILGMADDLSYRTGLSIRLSKAEGHPGCIALEVPNKARASVSLAEVVASPEFRSERGHDSDLIATVGVDTQGKPVSTNVAKWPHALVGGTNGGGKSTLINSVLVSLLLRYGPDQLRLILVDPKQVEFFGYEPIPHLMCPPLLFPAETIPMFAWVEEEMERRYTLMRRNGVRELAKLNEQLPSAKRLPRIVIVIDEARDIMEDEDSRKAVIASAKSLASMARASGVHLIFATQKPTVNVVDGTVKGNLTTRIALRVVTHTESGVILDQDGAQNLLGKGDLLLMDAEGKVTRAQSPFAQDDEIHKIVEWWADWGRQHPESYRYDAGLIEAIEPVVLERKGGVPDLSVQRVEVEQVRDLGTVREEALEAEVEAKVAEEQERGVEQNSREADAPDDCGHEDGHARDRSDDRGPSDDGHSPDDDEGNWFDGDGDIPRTPRPKPAPSAPAQEQDSPRKPGLRIVVGGKVIADEHGRPPRRDGGRDR